MMTAGSSRGEAELRALFEAIAERDRGAVARLLQASPELARRPLSVGATRSDYPAAHFFETISHYAYSGDTALHVAAAAHTPEITTDLISCGADVRARNRRGAEPLHYAADGAPGSSRWDPEAQSAVVQLLLAAGADPNARDKSGVPPLHRAVRTRCAAAVRALLSGGADPLLMNGAGSRPLHLAVQNTGRGGSGEPAAQAAQAEIIGILIDHGARPSDKNQAGKTVAESVRSHRLLALLERGRSTEGGE